MGKHRACVQTGKICFESHDRALPSDEAASHKWSAYQCRYCGRYHISSNSTEMNAGRTKRKRRALKLQGKIR
jgi:hypothetical protein